MDLPPETDFHAARAILSRLFRLSRPTSVIHVGCGDGAWLHTARGLDVALTVGVSSSAVPASPQLFPADTFLSTDLAEPGLADRVLATGAAAKFDLVLCLDVAECLPCGRSASFVEDLCRLGDVVLFSAAIPFQWADAAGQQVNQQWPEFWATHFRHCGFRCFDVLRLEFWTDPAVPWPFVQNLLVFVREDSAAFAGFPAEAMDGPLSLVHPAAWLTSILNHWHPQRAAARGDEEADLAALMQGWMKGAAAIPALRTLDRAASAAAGAIDVFPHTRMIVGDPEAAIARLGAELLESRDQARAAAQALSETAGIIASLRREKEAAEAATLEEVKLRLHMERDRLLSDATEKALQATIQKLHRKIEALKTDSTQNTDTTLRTGSTSQGGTSMENGAAREIDDARAESLSADLDRALERERAARSQLADVQQSLEQATQTIDTLTNRITQLQSQLKISQLRGQMKEGIVNPPPVARNSLLSAVHRLLGTTE